MSHDPSGTSELDSIASLMPAFDFDGLIAKGAAGAVYKARQRSLDRDVAIRILPREKAEDPAFRSSFEAMGKVMGGLAHPGLIRVYDSGEVNGLPFMVMEYVPGKSLRQSAHGKAIDPRQAVQIILAACHGLAHAHGQGIAHGAIRPANILLTPKCEPKIGNFGFTHPGRQNGVGEDASAYQAPELSAGSGCANPQSDVFAIGLLLQELLTGVPAGTANGAGIALPDPKLAAICQKAAHPDPVRRFADAGTLAEALGQWSASRTTHRAPLRLQTTPSRPKAQPISKPPAVTYRAPRAGRALLIHSTIIAALLLAIHGVWGAYQAKQESFARLRSVEDAKPRVILVKAQPGKQAPQGMDSSLVQLKP